MDRRVMFRIGCKLSVVVAALSASAIASSPSAWAAPELSSIIIPRALPGMVEAPPGPGNGPMTQSGLQSALSLVNVSSNAANGVASLGQAIQAGEVSGYTRTWVNEPPNGAFAEVIVLQFPSADDAAAALAGAEDSPASGFGHFAVPEIAHAGGASGTINSSLGLVTEHMVWFAKGPNMFDVLVGQVTTAANSGQPELSDADAIQIAGQEAAFAPGSLTAPSPGSAGGTDGSFYVAGEALGGFLLIGLVVGLVLMLIRRGRPSAEPTFAGGGFGLPPQDGHSFVAATSASGNQFGTAGSAQSLSQRRTALLERPRVNHGGYYCSWCGEQIAVGIGVNHDCGSRTRPALYCMNCGTTFNGATVCPGCGSPKLQ